VNFALQVKSEWVMVNFALQVNNEWSIVDRVGKTQSRKVLNALCFKTQGFYL
jgi:hypothetical protein